ncbi:helix-turn-helix domain-containing protein [Leptobacterium flavescens]|uniref:Helix-turn-helix domain-containing protein n=1 Tax=Leptobacterium flavescens TaxID=472055 RepID=A0A6P0UQE8_9FLAO|nr:helix-turn-helix domain-containing protein [Leptobacterium flavescens]NER13103.1 helix-turn-helix domain-containing protein [Leptobacterium flavescens]
MLGSGHIIRKNIRQTIWDQLKKAQFAIYVVELRITDSELMDILINKLDQGLDIRIILPKGGMNASVYQSLKVFAEKGGKLSYGYFHRRYYIIDHRILITPSSEDTKLLEDRGWEQNGILINDHLIEVRELLQNFKKLENWSVKSDFARMVEPKRRVRGVFYTDKHPLFKKLRKDMEERKIYKDGDLSMYLLAKKLETNTSTLSKLINQVTGKKFIDFVNSYRVEEAKKILSSPGFGRYKISVVGKEVGFNTEGTFYSTFKKHTGTTPAKYREMVRSRKNAEGSV